MSKSEIARYLTLRTIGNFLVLLALYGVVATFGPIAYYETTYRIAQLRGVEYSVAQEPIQGGFGAILDKENNTNPQDQGGGLASVLAGPQKQVLVPKDTTFSIVIPKIGASAKVIPNVDANSEKDYLKALQLGIAHAQGSVFPGIPGNIYLFAHSADNFWDAGRYNAVFYLLKDLTKDDDVVVFFEDKRHDYKVKEVKVVDASEVQDLVKAQESGKEQLILQTCFPPGTTWKRLIVVATPK